MPRKPVALRVRTYEVVSEAVERGVSYGVRRAFKHEDAPPSQVLVEDVMGRIVDQVLSAVMNELCEVVDFDA